MAISKQEAQRELALRELSRRRLDYFVPYVDPFFWNEMKWYVFKPFHKIITDCLEKILSRKSKKIMISVPPQHWKSTISSQRFPLYALMKDPTLQIVLASYSSDLSSSHLSKARQLIDGKRFKNIGNIELIKDSQTELITKQGWSFTSVGVWWSLTGKPVDIGIIDDVHKDRQEYESDTIRNKVWDWYTSVFLSRLHKDSAQILVMTRWWEDDLFWRIIALEWDEWEIINIPVMDDKDTIFPERFPMDFIESKRKTMWERDFQSLYMGDPINIGWWDFNKDYFLYYDAAPSTLRIYTFLDPAISQKQEADYSAIVTIWIDPGSNNIYVLDVFQERVLPWQLIDELFRIVKDFNPLKVWVEVVQFQKMLALEIRNQMRIRNRYFTLEEIIPRWEKEARIRSILQPRYSNRMILHTKQMQDLELELLKFPNGKNDDMIDAMSWAISMANTVDISQKSVPKPVKSYFNRMTGRIEYIK